MTNTRTPQVLCWHCDRMLDGLTPAKDDPIPEPGGVTICLYCGAVGILADDLSMRQPIKEELDKLGEDPEFRSIFAQVIWARQYVMLNENLMRDRDDPDR